MVRVQCQSNLLHQTTNGDNTGRTPEARFSWSSNSASFVAAKVLLANYYIRTILLLLYTDNYLFLVGFTLLFQSTGLKMLYKN